MGAIKISGKTIIRTFWRYSFLRMNSIRCRKKHSRSFWKSTHQAKNPVRTDRGDVGGYSVADLRIAVALKKGEMAK